MSKTKLVYGLSDFHIATVKQDTRENLVYGNVQRLEGAVEVSVTPNMETNTKYADNRAFAVLNNLADIDVTLSAVDIPAEIKKEIFGNKEENGVIFSNANDIIADVALGFRAETQGGGSRFYWLLKGKPEAQEITHATSEGGIESQDASLNMKFIPTAHNGNWKAELDSEVVSVDDWFEQVVYDEATANAITGGSIED